MWNWRDNVTTITESPVSEDGSECTFTYDYEDKGTAPFVRWVDRELAAGRRFRAWHANEKARNKEFAAAVVARDERIGALEKQIGRYDVALGEVTQERDAARDALAKTPVCKFCSETQRLYRESESWKSQSELWEKRYAACDAALKAASRVPPLTRRKVWRVCGAKGMQLIALEGGVTDMVTGSEFWRAARKLGVPVDEVGDRTIERDVMVFRCKNHLASLPPGPSAIETSVYVIE